MPFSSASVNCMLQYLSGISKIGHFGGFAHKKTFSGRAIRTRCRSSLHSSGQNCEHHKDIGRKGKGGAEGQRKWVGHGKWKAEGSDAEVRSAGDKEEEWGGSIELDKGKGRRDSIMTGWIRIWYTFVGHRQHIHLSQHSRTVYSTCSSIISFRQPYSRCC